MSRLHTCILVACCLLTTQSCSYESDSNVRTRDVTLDFGATKIYMRARIWGILGDHEETRLQSTPVTDGSACNSDCLVIYSERIFFKQQGTNRLVIYAIESAVPVQRVSNIRSVEIEIHEIKTNDELERIATKERLDEIEAR